jgi:hypothetical protein
MVASVAFGALSDTEKLQVINLSFILKNSSQYVRYIILQGCKAPVKIALSSFFPV